MFDGEFSGLFESTRKCSENFRNINEQVNPTIENLANLYLEVFEEPYNVDDVEVLVLDNAAEYGVPEDEERDTALEVIAYLIGARGVNFGDVVIDNPILNDLISQYSKYKGRE
jgi:hypothetical protein